MKTEVCHEHHDSKEDDTHPVNAALKLLFDNCDVIAAVLAITVDGYKVCEYKRRDISLTRLTAMGSTLISLGDAITDDMRMGACKNIICENEEGIVIFMHINKDLILAVFTYEQDSLGLLLSVCRRSVENLKKLNQTELRQCN